MNYYHNFQNQIEDGSITDCQLIEYAEKTIQILELKLKLEKSKNDFLMEVIKKLIKK